MKSHALQVESIRKLAVQVDQSLDTSKNFRLVLDVKDGVVHAGVGYGKCKDCDRYDELLSEREKVRAIDKAAGRD